MDNYLELLRTRKKNGNEGKDIEPSGGREKFYDGLKGNLQVDSEGSGI